MTWTKTGNIRGPQGSPGATSTVPGPQGATGAQGPQGLPGAASTVPGPQGLTGVQGPAGPGLATGGGIGQLLIKTGSADYQTGWQVRQRNWRLYGDNTGDSTNSASATWSTVKSPVFTAPANGYYRVNASAGIFVGANAVVAAIALMIDANVARMFYFTGAASYYQPVTLNDTVQLTTGQKLTIGFRPTVNAKVVSLQNSNTIVPVILVQEVDTPT